MIENRNPYDLPKKTVDVQLIQERHDKKITYLLWLTLPRKSCQDRSPTRNPLIGKDPLTGITIAIGDLASTTLLQNQLYCVRITLII
jgi:hypothetical protein